MVELMISRKHNNSIMTIRMHLYSAALLDVNYHDLDLWKSPRFNRGWIMDMLTESLDACSDALHQIGHAVNLLVAIKRLANLSCAHVNGE